MSVWMSSYVQTYLERDVRLLRQVGDLTQFQIFVRALAIRSAQLLDWTDLSRELGVAVNTVKAWAGVLEASDQILILRPYFENLGKRLVKTPKVYFTDTGLVAHLAGLTHAESLSRGPMAGPLFETCVVLEVWKTLLARGVEPRLYFWRTSDGREVDLVVESEGRLIPLEAKATSTPRPMHAAGIASFRSIYGRRAARGYVVHSGAVTGTLGPDADALPYVDL